MDDQMWWLDRKIKEATERAASMDQRSKDDGDEHLRWYYHGVKDGVNTGLRVLTDRAAYLRGSARAHAFLQAAHADRAGDPAERPGAGCVEAGVI